ncbi:MAG: hypothetical protein J5720_07480 [Bacteroidaceae bacterium]|nr:hypothetical protein [Bacteroidaceae bacterium]
MKKLFLASIVALAMGFAFVSCNQTNAPVDIKTDGTPEEVLTDIVAKAKADGANWTIDQWKYVYKQATIAIKPMMLEIAELTKEDNITEENIGEVMEKLGKLQTQYEPIEKLMDEFNEIAKATPNGKAVDEDKEFEKQLQEELGLPDL